MATIGTVIHKNFGKGTVVKINNNEKFIYIKRPRRKEIHLPRCILDGILGNGVIQ